jgi:hypothetical protein
LMNSLRFIFRMLTQVSVIAKSSFHSSSWKAQCGVVERSVDRSLCLGRAVIRVLRPTISRKNSFPILGTTCVPFVEMVEPDLRECQSFEDQLLSGD